MKSLEKLDNPVRYSLEETHQQQCISYTNSLFYDPRFCVFGALRTPKNAAEDLLAYAQRTDSFYIIGDPPKLPEGLRLVDTLQCLQMVLEKPIEMENSHRIDRLETDQKQQDLFALVNKVQPGYFREQTAALGNYYGIYDQGTLVACCGERMQMKGFTEISAIVTQPKSRGKGYAKQLTKHTTDFLFQQNKIPYLHVLESNDRAIALYGKLGFRTRRKLTFWSIGTRSGSSV